MNRVEKLKEFLRQQPNDSFLKHALALEYIKLGDDEHARRLFEEILAFEPGYTGTYYHLAALLQRNGNREGALAVYEKGMQVCREKGDRHALNELQAAYEDLED
jgi:Tfp pilus assembly protein PilF